MEMQILNIIAFMGASSILISFIPLLNLSKIFSIFKTKQILLAISLILLLCVSAILYYFHLISAVSVISIRF